ncbi:MAG TPA: hypothetical protein VGO67_07785 [Verrucomicrobiae bacterium]
MRIFGMREFLVFAFCVVGFGAYAAPINLDQQFKLRTETETIAFVPGNQDDLHRLASRVDRMIEEPDDESKHERRGLEEIARLAKAATKIENADERRQLEIDLVETVCAVNNLERPVIPRHFDAVMLPIFLRQLHRPIGVGVEPAENLAPGPSADLSRRDPMPSSFWSRPKSIATEDLYAGFDRVGIPSFADKVCRYREAKETSGMNPGYEVECGNDVVKWKFGEQSSEPLVTRMFWALGFNADPTDYAASVKVAYDRRIFTEFNSRRPVRMTFTVLWFIPVYSMNLQAFKDPFDFVTTAVLRDGRQWSGHELKQHLMSGTNFQPGVEAQIDYLVTTPANVQIKDPRVKSIGPWDYGQLDHAGRREVRGAGLLAAWLGFYDTRFDNTKLRRVGPKKNPHLEHYFSDLGGGLGRTTGLLAWHGENVNAFPWRFTAPSVSENSGSPRQALKIVGYTPIVRNPAFAAMTIDDARWMARLIGQLSAEQIRQALAASGYGPKQIQLYASKLLSRRNTMMLDLGLSEEFPPLALNDTVAN